MHLWLTGLWPCPRMFRPNGLWLDGQVCSSFTDPLGSSSPSALTSILFEDSSAWATEFKQFPVLKEPADTISFAKHHMESLRRCVVFAIRGLDSCDGLANSSQDSQQQAFQVLPLCCQHHNPWCVNLSAFLDSLSLILHQQA